MYLTTEKLREYIKHIVKGNTGISEDNDYIYFRTKDMLDGIVLTKLGYTVAYRTKANHYVMRATKPEWYNKNDIVQFLTICPDVQCVEETDTHIYFDTDNIEVIFTLRDSGYKYIYQEDVTTRLFHVSVRKK